MSKERNRQHDKPGSVEIRPDLQDPSQGKDLSYLNEMPQMGRDEGVKAGIPPPPEESIERRHHDKKRGQKS